VLDAVIAQLRCPVCGDPLTDGGTALTCPRRHSFDVAKQGYVDLTAGRATFEGDSVAMVAAREAVHAAGLLDMVVDRVVDAVRGAKDRDTQDRDTQDRDTQDRDTQDRDTQDRDTQDRDAQGDRETRHRNARDQSAQRDRGAQDRYTGKLIVEVGAGTGDYLAAALDAWPEAHGLAVDVSKPALRRAARAHPRMNAIRADVWRGLPISDASVDVVLDVFAPRSGAEFARIIRQDGIVVIAAAQPGHLAELTRPLNLLEVDPAKNDRLNETLTPWLEKRTSHEITETIHLNREQARALISMGPNAHHIDLDDLPDDLAERATVRVDVTTWGRLRR
jgi:23S rRNA (guanine745-N1)-methyltransferase